jgi:thiamine-phosphate pyrophosphorylase
MPRKLSGLYVIIDPALARGRSEADVAREAVAGGASMIQLRDKSREKGLQLPMAEGILGICRASEVPFIINDHVDLALAIGADGVHVGQKDLPVAAVRRIVPPEMIVGCSTNNPEEARRAQAAGADYVSVGRLFPTGSKDDTRPATLDTLRAVKAAVTVPVCAIGGVNETNIRDVIAAGADIVSVISAVVSADDVRGVARKLAAAWDKGA